MSRKGRMREILRGTVVEIVCKYVTETVTTFIKYLSKDLSKRDNSEKT